MSQYKLLALDMDGTLLNNEHKVSDVNLYWIKKAIEHGVIVMLSTGRGYINAINYAEEMELDAPLICANGGEIWRRPDELLRRTTLEPAWMEKLYELTKQYPNTWYWAYTTERVYNKDNWHELQGSFEQYQWLKFGFADESVEIIQEIRQHVEAWQSLEISNSSIYNVEINPNGVSKASALEFLCDVLRINLQEVIAVGDSLNDIKAIQAVGLGVAMENAQDAVKAAADYVTLSNNDHGVAEVIRRFIFNGEQSLF